MTDDWSKSGLDLHLERRPEVGWQAGLEEALRTAILDGRLLGGARVPPTRDLAAELGVARGTVTGAYEQLVAEGFLTARHGAGTTVAAVPRTSRANSQRASPLNLPPVRHDLMVGRPDTAAFPVQPWIRATRNALTAMPSSELALRNPIGVVALREALAGYLGRTRGVRAHPDRIMITNGFMQSLGLIASVLAVNATMALEDPCLNFHRELVRRTGRKVLPLPVDELGASSDVPGDAAAVVVTPAHQAVLGVVLAPERRRALLEWATGTDGLIIEDDYDGEFRYDRQPIGALQAMGPDRVAYLGTTSKTLAPGLRLGWMVLPQRLVDPVTEAKFYADGATEVLGQHILADLINNHDYDRHIRTQRARYRRRRDQLINLLHREVPHVRVRGAAAGLQLMLELPPDGPTAEEVEAAAATRGVRVVAADSSWHSTDQPGNTAQPGNSVAINRHTLGVGYAAPPEHGFTAAVEALVAVLREVHRA